MNCKVIVVAGSVALAGIGCAGCGRGPSSPAAPLGASTTSPSTGNAHGTSTVPSDYTRLLISPQDVLAPNDSYSGPPPTLNPNGTAGAKC